MLQFLQTGKVLYVLAGVCGLGIISKLVTSSLYKRLVKETGNMALTKNKNLRSFKQRTENMLLISHSIRNTNAYIEKQLYSFRFMNLSLDSWDNLSVQAMILCFLIGGIAAFGAYWYRCDSYYIVLYGTMGILTGLFLVLVDNSVNISMKRQQLGDCLVDYVENSPHFYRSVDKSMSLDGSEKRARSLAESSKVRLREMGRKNLKVVEETTVSGELCDARSERETIGEPNTEHEPLKVEESPKNGKETHGSGRFSVLSRKKGRKEPVIHSVSSGKTAKGAGSPGDIMVAPTNESLSQEEELRKSIDGLKQSLEQIAASREQSKRDVKVVKASENNGLERARGELKPEDIKLLGEILQEYLT